MTDEMTLRQIQSGGGVYYQIGRQIINALLRHKVDEFQSRKVWSDDFPDQIALVAKGTHKIVAKAPEEIALTETLDPGVRLKAVREISDQEVLEKVAFLAKEGFVRSAAFDRIVSDEVVYHHATTLSHGAATMNRVTRIKSHELLYSLAFGAAIEGVADIAIGRLAKIAPTSLAELACCLLNVRRAKLSVRALEDGKLLSKIASDSRTRLPVKNYANQRTQEMLANWDPLSDDPRPV